MARLEDLKKDTLVKGILTSGPVTVVDARWYGSVVEVTYKGSDGSLGQALLYRENEPDLEVVESGRVWSFDGDGKFLRLVSEAYRIHLAYLFDPLLAVHTSQIEPLPHQITAVYEEMLTRQPLRFLLADDPGAGKTIMTGLLIKELIVRGDLARCMIVCPGGLVEQWQDELRMKFQLDFKIVTRDMVESTISGNPFVDNPLVIARLDHLARNEDLLARLGVTDWDLVVCDEAHKMSASLVGREIKETKRYKLGKLLSQICRHYLLLSATPHNGRAEDFQLFMALLDGDRFETHSKQGVHQVEVGDMMRRLSKEEMKTFDGKPLFPERIAYSANYSLSPAEIHLYQEVTDYVSDGMNRAERLNAEGQKRRGNSVGFALQILQRRLASSPAAIHESLKRRLVRLEKSLREEEALRRGASVARPGVTALRTIREENIPYLTDEDIEDLDDAPESEIEAVEEKLADSATAALSIEELRKEIDQLRDLERLAAQVRASGTDRKWEELRNLLQNDREMLDSSNHLRKLIIFTEHRDTLAYLHERISNLLGRGEEVVAVHGSMLREERRDTQESFLNDPSVRVLVATDAAGEGVNLQRAHLMVNYDLPWNPNRIEQRFGRIHRIGQTEVCHLWNLIAHETREGDVFRRLFEKLNLEREALGGHVFDVLGQVFSEHSLRNLLIEAIRYGDKPEVRDRLKQQVDEAFDHSRLTELVEERALVRDSMDMTKVLKIREDMERAAARRLQPHFIQEFFVEAFTHLGGAIHRREAGRFEIKNVPVAVRSRDRQIGVGPGVLKSYERITFEKDRINVEGRAPAQFICPGHSLLDSVIDLIREKYGHLLKMGALLVDPSDLGTEIRALFYLEHSIQDGRINKDGTRRIVSRRLHFVEMDHKGSARSAGYAPYLDYRPATEEETQTVAAPVSGQWLTNDLESMAVGYAVEHLVRSHLDEVKKRREELTAIVETEVKRRLFSEIGYWDKRYSDLREQEMAGRQPAFNSMRAKEIGDDLRVRLERRVEELKQERNVSSLPPFVVGGALIVPEGLLASLGAVESLSPVTSTVDGRERVELLAMEAVMEAERGLGRVPRDVSSLNLGYDIESLLPDEGRLLCIEVKGRQPEAGTVHVTKNEILTALNKEDEFVLALVEVDGTAKEPVYLRTPFTERPDFDATGVVYDIGKLRERAAVPS